MKTKASGILDCVLDGSAVLSGAMLIITMLVISTDVIFRYFFFSPLIGVDEITANMLLYITFLGAAWLLRRRGHIAIDIIFSRLKPRAQAWLNAIFSIVGVGMSLVLVWYGILSTLDVYLRGAVTPTILELPRAALIIIIPIGSLLLFLQFLRNIWARRLGS